jgi:putative tryptophan/tyrosine transport system substrate-binding protein
MSTISLDHCKGRRKTVPSAFAPARAASGDDRSTPASGPVPGRPDGVGLGPRAAIGRYPLTGSHVIQTAVGLPRERLRRLEMRRREFIAGLGGAAAWPLAASAQQDTPIRRIAWLVSGSENDRDRQVYQTALRESLSKLGWIEGRNLRIDLRWGDDLDGLRRYALELVSLTPDVILTNGSAATRSLQRATQTIPIVFAGGPDPVAAGLVRNVARPEGNITGFSSADPSIAGKQLELLKEAAPHVARVAIIFNVGLASEISLSYSSSIEAAASVRGLRAIPVPVRNAVDIVNAIDAFAGEPGGGILVLPPPPTDTIRDVIFQLANQHRLPAIYPGLPDVAAGGLLAYAQDRLDQYRRAASYIDRLLRGAKVGELPVQVPTKFELVINLKAAKAIGLTIPVSFLLRADQVIE